MCIYIYRKKDTYQNLTQIEILRLQSDPNAFRFFRRATATGHEDDPVCMCSLRDRPAKSDVRVHWHACIGPYMEFWKFPN